MPTFEALRDWKPERPTYGVVGFPVAHSLSPGMHQAGLKAAGIDADYLRFEIRPDELAEGLDLLEKAGVCGLNLTVPHKQLATGLGVQLSAEAARIGATNTLLFRDRKREGHNTDGRGFSNAIREEFRLSLRDLRILIIGIGGAGRAVAFQCAQEQCEKLVLMNRTVDKALSLVNELGAHYDRKEKWLGLSFDSPKLYDVLADIDLIVNTTSLGLDLEDPSPLSGDFLLPRHLVFDSIYNPPQTSLLKAAQQVGAKTANGLSMLLHQGALSFELWFGIPAPMDALRSGLRQS